MTDLTLKDMEELLNLTQSEITAMIESNKIPAYKIKGHYHFNRAEIKEWIIENNIKVSKKILDIDLSHTGVSLVNLIGRGGVFYDVEGATVTDVIKNTVQVIPLPPTIPRETLTYSLLHREEMMPTAIGKGIAVPHPREPLLTKPENQSISICFLKEPIDFHALDHEPVHTLFVILSADQTRHVETLSRISFLCQDEKFIDLLKTKAAENEILDYIMVKELEWHEG
ncbi:MAG: PTS sugar transporter subunit IIA [Spirochaetales bacterium]|nr:PTS sugar transporter subunit IIA [Spirochaetales bacterium]